MLFSSHFPLLRNTSATATLALLSKQLFASLLTQWGHDLSSLGLGLSSQQPSLSCRNLCLTLHLPHLRATCLHTNTLCTATLILTLTTKQNSIKSGLLCALSGHNRGSTRVKRGHHKEWIRFCAARGLGSVRDDHEANGGRDRAGFQQEIGLLTSMPQRDASMWSSRCSTVFECSQRGTRGATDSSAIHSSSGHG